MSAIYKYLVLISLFLSTSIIVKAQVGIGTNNPDPNSILDIRSATKGVLLPRPVDINAVVQRNGALIYDSIKGKIKVYYNSQWQNINPLTLDASENVTTPANETVTGTLTVNGNSITALNADVKAKSFEGYGITPIGGIMMWGGTTSLFDAQGNGTGILDGWALCDGQNARPDLRGRFIVGYSKSTATGTTDGAYNPKLNMEALSDYSAIGSPNGSKEVILSNEQMPIHDHDVLNNGVHKITGNIPLTGGSAQQTVLAFDQDGLTTPGSSTYDPNIGNSKIGLTVRKAGGIYTNDAGPNTKLKAGCTPWEYSCICSDYPYNPNNAQYTIQTSDAITINTPYTTDYQSISLSWSPDTKAWPIYSGSTFTNIYANSNVGITFIATSQCTVNPGYENGDCVSDNYNSKLNENEPIIYNESWTGPKPIDTRPPYYVLAYIIRIK